MHVLPSMQPSLIPLYSGAECVVLVETLVSRLLWHIKYAFVLKADRQLTYAGACYLFITQ